MALDTKVHVWTGISRFIFGVNAAEQTGSEAKLLTDGRNCLIITDPGVEKVGLVNNVKPSLEKEGFHVEVCAEVEPEPSLTSIKIITDIARKKKVDIIVGIGGGSSMDTAKIVASAVKMTEPLENYLTKALPVEGIPVIAIPTTSGTGAEATPDAVVRLPEQRVKSWYDNVRPKTAIIDQTLMLKLPPRLTASTGIDALAHAIESQMSLLANRLTRTVALESVRIISKSLRKAVSDGSDLEVRSDMAWATLMEAFSEGVAMCIEGHGIGHITGPYYGLKHGEACGIALPYAMEFNLPFSDMEIMASIGEAMASKAIGQLPRKAAEIGIVAVKKLIEDVGLPSKLADIGNARESDIPELVDLYISNPNIGPAFSTFCPHAATKEELTKLITNMFNGLLESKA